MHTVRIISQCQPTKYDINGTTVIFSGSGKAQDIDVLHWLELQKICEVQINGGHIYPANKDEEQKAIDAYRQELWSRFEVIGIPVVKVSSESGEFSKGILRSFASEWLEFKSEHREIRRDSREEESLSISRKALSNSTRANIIAIIAMLLSVATAIAVAFITDNDKTQSTKTSTSTPQVQSVINP